ncbi:MAG: NAD(P)/FAD-dependent oxidoreductase [Vicinamibacterales bacterium]
MTGTTPHVVIIGGGFGGLSAARALAGRAVRVTLLDRRNHHVFQPLLYQVATATLSPGDIASPIRWILRRARNVSVLLADVKRVDVAQRRVELVDTGVVDYDYLIVATGASHAYFGHDEWAPSAPGLKTLDDALEIRRRILMAFERAERESEAERRRELLTFVLVGGGPTGVELAGTLAEIANRTLRQEFRSIDTGQTRIVLIEAGPTILASFPPSLRDAARRSLSRLNVEVCENTRVTGIDGHGVWLGTERLTAGTVVWAAGVTASAVARSLGAATDRAGRVLVRPDLTLPDHPEVFVVGDAAVLAGADGQPLPGVAQVAMQGAAYAARAIVAQVRGAAPLPPFAYRNRGNMAIVGRGAAVADLGWIRFSGPLAWLAWLGLHIAFLIGFRSRAAVMLQWATAYFTSRARVTQITSGPWACRPASASMPPAG